MPPTRPDWLTAIRRYFAFSALGHALWEAAQMPFYTIWRDGTWPEILFAGLHCAGGDLLIATAALIGALVIAGNSGWPGRGFGAVAVLTLVIGFTYTVFSEWLNTEVRGSWAYADIMPLLPVIGTGLTPLLQWIVVPIFALRWARRGA
jgi:hypothetical protein